jgi:hypothetical protein
MKKAGDTTESIVVEANPSSTSSYYYSNPLIMFNLRETTTLAFSYHNFKLNIYASTSDFFAQEIQDIRVTTGVSF